MVNNDQQQAPEAAPGGGVIGGAPVGAQAPPLLHPLDDMGDIGAAVADITVNGGQMVSVLETMAAQINTLKVDSRFTKLENKHLLIAARKAKLAVLVGKLSNPMSIRAVTMNAKLDNMVQDLLSIIKSNGQLRVPVSFDDMTLLIESQVVVLEELSRLLLRDTEIHLITKESHIGWALLPFLDEEETAEDEKDSLKLIKSKVITDAEKAFMSFHVDKNKIYTYSKGAGGRGGGRGARGGARGGVSARKGKGGRGGKNTLNQVSGGNVGKSSKPRSGGCHRCGGPHFVRSCTVAVQKPAA